MLNTRTAAEIAGLIDPICVGQAEHPMTAEERTFAIEISHELAASAGLDLDQLVIAHEADQRNAGHAMGYTDNEIDRMWAGR